MHVSVSSFKPEQPGPFVHDLVLLLVPLPQVLEHLLHVLHGCHSDNGKIKRKQPFVKIALCCSCSSGFVCETSICKSVFLTKLLFRNGTGLFGLADLGHLGMRRFGMSNFGLSIRSGDISVTTFRQISNWLHLLILMIIQAGEMSRYLVLCQRPYWESWLRLNMNFN